MKDARPLDAAQKTLGDGALGQVDRWETLCGVFNLISVRPLWTPLLCQALSYPEPGGDWDKCSPSPAGTQMPIFLVR